MNLDTKLQKFSTKNTKQNQRKIEEKDENPVCLILLLEN